MRRELPPRPHLDHLKKQAKDLLDAHQRGEPDALDRIRRALPAFAGREREEVARSAFALHDAQSAIAREYGFASWRELRAHVVELSDAPFSEQNLRAVLHQYASVWPVPPPPELFGAMRSARTRERRASANELLRAGVPQRLPLFAVRNALMLRTMVAPFHVGRAISLAALDAASQAADGTLAVFAQRSELDESITFEGLHPIGCEARVHLRRPDGQGRAFVVLEALRAITLHSIEPRSHAAGALFARVSAFELDEQDPSSELPALNQQLRSIARQLTVALPEPEPAAALLDRLDDADLADAVVGNLPCSVAEKATFAAEPKLVGRLRIALQLIQTLAGSRGPA